MAGHDADLDFPECCAHCPHLRQTTASCDHDLRQSLIREVTAHGACSVYSTAKTEAMRNLSVSLDGRS